MTRATSQKTVVSRLFAASTRPIYLLDASRRIVFVNESLSRWLGVTPEDPLGRRSLYCNTDGEEKTELANQLCPAPQAWECPIYAGTITVSHDAVTQQRSATFLRLSTDQESASMLVIVDEQETKREDTVSADAETLHQQILSLRESWSCQFTLDRLVGQSPAMRQVRGQVAVATESACRVLIVGRSGSGRETVARTIHHHRCPAARAPLVPLSCSVLDAALLASTVEAFAERCAELRDEAPGTLLLLEVDQLSPEAQAALLDFLEISELELQTLATCQQRLSQLVSAHRFRADLACQLTTLEICLPRLADRMEDVPFIAQWLVEERNRHSKKQLGGFTPDAMDALLGYGWPGETAELRDLVHSVHQQAVGPLIEPIDLPKKLVLAADADAMAPVVDESIVLDTFLAEVETELIRRALRQAKGNKAKTARLLNVSRPRLLRRIEQLGL